MIEGCKQDRHGRKRPRGRRRRCRPLVLRITLVLLALMEKYRSSYQRYTCLLYVDAVRVPGFGGRKQKDKQGGSAQRDSRTPESGSQTVDSNVESDVSGHGTVHTETVTSTEAATTSETTAPTLSSAERVAAEIADRVEYARDQAAELSAQLDDLLDQQAREQAAAWAATRDHAAELAEQSAHQIQEQMNLAAAALLRWYQRAMSIILYKPPVGIVSIFLSLRLFSVIILQQRTKREQVAAAAAAAALGQDPDMMVTDTAPLMTTRQKRRKFGKAQCLDTQDGLYNSKGGIHPIRRQLCFSAVHSLLHRNAQWTNSVDRRADPHQKTSLLYMTTTLQDALQVTSRPGRSRVYFIQDLVDPLSRLEGILYKRMQKRKKKKNSTSDAYPGTSVNIDKEMFADLEEEVESIPLSTSDSLRLFEISYLTIQIRAMDALLRVCRDRLLKTTYRLARTREHWQQRAKAYVRMGNILQSLFRSAIDAERVRLSYADAVFKEEVMRLGLVAQVISDRPCDMEESYLLQARRTSTANNVSTKSKGLKQRKSFLSSVAQYSVRWNADGRGRLSVRKLEDNGEIHRDAAVSAVLNGNTDDWVQEAKDWMAKSRQILCHVLRESLMGSSSPQYDESAFAELEEQWLNGQDLLISQNETDLDTLLRQRKKTWLELLNLIDSIPSWRRVGEGKIVRLGDLISVGWTRKLDFFGIPSSALILWASYKVNNWVEPHWPYIKKDLHEAYHVGLEILTRRVWVPAMGIINDIMNKDSGMMSALSVDDEQGSLGRMLQDLGFGDGSAETQREALQKATEQYEAYLRQGLLYNLVQGKLVRLLLIQVQQLKVGLLSALETIDVLMAGNRIHFQLLAIIPAILMAYFGTRFFVRALYNIRSKDLRPVTVVHGNMGEFLSNIESIVLLSNPTDSTSVSTSAGRSKNNGLEEDSLPVHDTWLQELGQILLNMHRYLILLEFSSPPFPSLYCDAIHKDLNELLGSNLAILPQAHEYAGPNSKPPTPSDPLFSSSERPRPNKTPTNAAPLDWSLQQQHRAVTWIKLVKEKHQDLIHHL